jgi:DNA-binding transcriptional LysR family regulator
VNLNYYTVFLDIAKTHNLTETAERMNYTQSGVSHIVAELEKQLGVTLLIRRKQGVLLTAEARQLVQTMQEVIAQNDKLLQRADHLSGHSGNVVRVGTFLSVAVHWLPHILRKFERENPEIRVVLRDGLYQDVEKWLAAGEIDCGFTSRSSRSDFEFIPLRSEPLLAVLPKDHPLAAQKCVTLKELSVLPFIVPGEGSNYDIGRMLEMERVSMTYRYSVNDDYAALAMVRNGLGVTIMPRLILEENRRGLCALPLKNDYERTIGIAIQQQGTRPVACGTFIDCTQRWLAERHK